MQIFKSGTKIDFVGKMKNAVIFSLVLIGISILSIILHRGLNLGIDFVGGTLVQIKFNQSTSIDKVRSAFKPVNLEGSLIQTFGADEMVVRITGTAGELKDLSAKIEKALTDFFGKGSFEIRRAEYVGPKVGKDLRNKAIMAIIFSWIGMLIYITWRFEFRYAAGGIIALIHDIIITIGFLSVLDKEFTLVIVAALLTVIGYSINDTIVIFDRIRENARRDTSMALSEIMNNSINQTLGRTLITSLTVLIVVVVLFFFGGAVIADFALTLIIGVVVGTYSSIFIASPIVLYFERNAGKKKKG